MTNKHIATELAKLKTRAVSEPLVTHMYTADPSAHVFEDRIYIYPSHDIEGGIPFNDNGDHFAMRDYHVFSLDESSGKVIDHGVALDIDDVPWASRQMWAPDAAYRNGMYYLFFPAKNPQGLFQIGVASSEKPYGPFKAADEPIGGSYSIDPAVFADEGDDYYLLFGGIWGGQLQHYRNNEYQAGYDEPEAGEQALGPRIAHLNEDMHSLNEASREILILDENELPLEAGDTDKRYFEGPWMHKHKGVYYLSYSTGDTHQICYATSDSPYGPFRFQGTILHPVVGWTTHHSICQHRGKWYLFYHDSLHSGGITHLRTMKMIEIVHNESGDISAIYPYGEVLSKSDLPA